MNCFASLRRPVAVTCMCYLLAAGCSSVPEAQYFVLAPSPEQAEFASNTLEISGVRLPTYLRQPGIAISVAPHQVHHARYYRWAEPLEEGFERALRSELQQRLSNPVEQSSVEVVVHYFHGDADGNVRLAVDWRQATDCGATKSASFFSIKEQDSDGYAAMVETQARLIGDLAQDISLAAAQADSCVAAK